MRTVTNGIFKAATDSDVLFGLLPLAVVAAVSLALSLDINLLLRPEMTFATITILGSSLSDLIRIKTEQQHDFSERLYGGTRFMIGLLVVATVLLALVILREQRVAVDAAWIARAQGSFLVVACFSKVLGVLVGERYEDKKYHLGTSIDRRAYFRYLESSLGSAVDAIEYAAYALEEYDNLKWTTTSGFRASSVWDSEAKARAAATLSDVERVLLRAQLAFQHLDELPSPPPALESS